VVALGRILVDAETFRFHPVSGLRLAEHRARQRGWAASARTNAKARSQSGSLDLGQ
jgi:hypothetical protein